MAPSDLTKQEALDTLVTLDGLGSPLWLAGGLAADFHVGRWTRHHDDIDLVTFEEEREALSASLRSNGFDQTDDDGWITRWTHSGRDPGEISIAFMRRSGADTGDLVIRPEGSRGGRIAEGVYPGVEGNLDAGRYRTLDGVAFRVVSAEDEWVFTEGYKTLNPTATPRPTVAHNLALLESVLSTEEIEQLRPLVGRRRPLEEVDAES